jgi:hypothetical protein
VRLESDVPIVKTSLTLKDPGEHVESIRQVFQKIEPTSRFVFEFGAHNGVQLSNSLDLIQQGWGALLIEYDRDLAAACKALHLDNSKVTVLQAEIIPDNIVELMQAAEVPEDVDLITVDIDCFDLYVWEAIVKVYKPKAVMVEYNRAFEPPIRVAVPYMPVSDPRIQVVQGDDYVAATNDFFGASLQAYCDLNSAHGYSLVWCENNDALFVQDQFFKRFGVEDNSPSALYEPPNATRWTQTRHPLRRRHPHIPAPFHPSGRGYPHSLLWEQLGLL